MGHSPSLSDEDDLCQRSLSLPSESPSALHQLSPSTLCLTLSLPLCLRSQHGRWTSSSSSVGSALSDRNSLCIYRRLSLPPSRRSISSTHAVVSLCTHQCISLLLCFECSSPMALHDSSSPHRCRYPGSILRQPPTTERHNETKWSPYSAARKFGVHTVLRFCSVRPVRFQV